MQSQGRIFQERSKIGRFAFFDKESHALRFGNDYHPKPSDDEVLLRVLTCGICRTGRERKTMQIRSACFRRGSSGFYRKCYSRFDLFAVLKEKDIRLWVLQKRLAKMSPL